MKTNLALVNYAKKALNEKWGYVLGSFGNTATRAFLNGKYTQGNGVGTYNSKHKDYIEKFLNKRVSDCYGLVKGFLWTTGNGEPAYKAAQDRNANSAYNTAKEKGTLSTLPEIPGIILWMKGHVGIYIGNGEFIECRGCPVGMAKGTIKNGVIASGSKFTHWFKDTYIKYVPTNPVSLVEQLKNNGYIIDTSYWQNVLDGKRTADKEHLKTLLERVVVN